MKEEFSAADHIHREFPSISPHAVRLGVNRSIAENSEQTGNKFDADGEFSQYLENYVAENPEYFADVDDIPQSQKIVLEGRFLEDILAGKFDGITKAEAWDLATVRLEDLGGRVPDERVDKSWIQSTMHSLEASLSESLQKTSINSENIGSYINAVSSILTHSSLNTRFVVLAELRRSVIRQHKRIKEVAEGAAAEAYKKLLSNPDYYGRLGDFFEKWETFYEDGEEYVRNPHTDWDKYDDNQELLRDILNPLGITDVEGFITAARRKDGQAYRLETGAALGRIAELEEERPGACHLLHDFYGIRGFARYPARLLVSQYDRHGKTNLPYGIYCSSIHDHNGAFGKDKHRSYGVYRELEGDYDLRIIEADTRLDLGRRLVMLDKLYGNDQKIKFAVVAAHGDKDSIILGSGMLFDQLGQLSITTKTHRSRRIFSPNPLIVLESCETGEEEGIAQKISADLGATVVAPPIDAATEKIIVVNGQQIKLEPQYAALEDENNPFSRRIPVEPVLYVNGRKANGEEYSRYFEELIQARRNDSEREELLAAEH